MARQPKYVKVPPQFVDLFNKAEDYVVEYFKKKVEDPTEGTISISGDRYVLIRAASLSIEFFDIISHLFSDKGEEVAHNIAKNILFDISHAIGKADAVAFHAKMKVEDPVEKLSAGPIHFAFTGWAFVDIFPESKPSPDENYYLIYDHPYSFESDAWIKKGKKTKHPVCIMNAGYSSGWCEESFGVKLVASEIMCKAMGDKHDRFIMAHPSRIEGFIKSYLKKDVKSEQKYTTYEIPGFFERKRHEEELDEKNKKLAKMNKFMMGRELKMIELKKEIKILKKKIQK